MNYVQMVLILKKKLLFEAWDKIALRVTEKIYSIAKKTHNEYEILIFLNAPVIDCRSSYQFDKNLVIEYATDDLLLKLRKHNRDVHLDLINTVVKCKISINVNDTVEQYLRQYRLGAKIAEICVDCIRLVRDEDIGVITLHISPIDDFTPHIRSNYDSLYQQDLSIFVPKRFYFKTEHTEPLLIDQVHHITNVLHSYLNMFRDPKSGQNVEGLDIAIQRFRSSYDRYLPDDPERLLDIAFAFEAIFLNDDENKELSYRLRLRAAKLLGKTLEERQEIFDIVKNLYNFRSKIAHGETLDAKKSKDADKLKQVLSRAPRMLKDAIIEMILGNAPRGLTDKGKIGDWWRKLELSLARENNNFSQEIRQLIYGKGRNSYRVIFTILETQDTAIVRILHIRHGSQQTIGKDPE